MSAKQIQGFFSHRAKSKGRPDLQAEEDFLSAEVEDDMVTVGSDVLAQTQASHPFTFDGHDICDLVAKKRLDKLTLPVLREIVPILNLKSVDSKNPAEKHHTWRCWRNMCKIALASTRQQRTKRNISLCRVPSTNRCVVMWGRVTCDY